ncbi:MAG: caspase family protein, partial [Thiotrichaceae bacterium]|nr:caspase family protein [Thiotrichaceae bacterium]
MNKNLIFPVMILVLLLNLSVFGISILNESVAYAANRTALVIGNSQYKSAPLKNPANDAKDIAALLEKCDFDVKLILNASRREMKMAVRSFGKTLRKSSGTGLFYYAGHGIQLKGRNYLIPVKSTIESEGDVEFEAVDAGLILNKMEDAGNKLNIVILDACRNNPFTRSFRSSSKGLARMDAPAGSLVAYATAPGSVAADGEGKNGIYTKHLLENMRKPGLTIEQVLKKVRVGVLSETGKKQTPWELSSLTGDFYFSQKPVMVASSPGYATGVLQISSQPTGADTFIHGNFQGKSPVEIKDIEPGSYTVKAVLKGYNTEDKKVFINSGRKAVVNFNLDKKAVKARLYVTTNPSDCRVRILNIAPAFYSGIELDQGRYKLEVS